MKELICVNCWGAFRAEPSPGSAVVCPLCGAPQPASAVPSKSPAVGRPSADLPLTGTTDPDLQGFRPEDAKRAGLRVDTAPNEFPGGLLADLEDAQQNPPPAGKYESSPTIRDVMPSQALLDELYERAKVDLKNVVVPTPSASARPALAAPPEPALTTQAQPAQAAPPPAAPQDASSSGVVMSWRLRLSSGLVLSFPSIDMVSSYASDKRSDQLALAFGDGKFVSYAAFVEVLPAAEGDPLAAMAELGGAPAPAKGPSLRAQTDPRGNERPRPTSDPGRGASTNSTEASAAAANARKKGPVLKQMTHQFHKPRAGAAPRDKRMRLVLFGVGILIGVGVIFLLILQGVFPG